MISEVISADGVESVALWLGTPDRPHFCWLDFPEDRGVVGAVVICPSMGLESVYSARALRDLARRLAASRWLAIRVDYAAMGDSAGSWTDPDLVAEWRRGIREAIEYSRGLGVERVAVVGLRVGATLAAAELGGGDGVDDLVLWDPCATGKAFLREQRALWAFLRSQAIEWGLLGEDQVWGVEGAVDEESFEAPGLMFSASTVQELEPVAIAPSDRDLAHRELILTREGRKVPRALTERETLPDVEFAEISGQEALLEVSAVTPEPTLERILSWLAPGDAAVRPVELPRQHAAAVHRTADGAGIVERPVTLGPLQLFGILSEREDPVGATVPTAVFFNAGRIGHQGPARVWVDLARECASRGVRCLRVDLSGLGDSPTRPGRTEGVEFPADGIEDVADIRRDITAAFGPQVQLVGLCSGGHFAIENALAEPALSVCAINPAISIFPWDVKSERRFEPNEEMALPDRDASHPWVSRTMARLGPLKDAVRKTPVGWWVLKRFFVKVSPAQIFERLTQSGVDVLVVAGEIEDHRLREGEQRRFTSLQRKDSFRMVMYPDLEHTLLERTGRDRVSGLALDFLVRGVAGSETGATGAGGAPLRDAHTSRRPQPAPD